MRRTIGLSLAGFGVALLLLVSLANQSTLRAQQSSAIVPASVVGGAFGGNPRDDGPPPVKLAAKPMTLPETRIWLKLREKVALSFPSETPLEDLVKFLRKTTVDGSDFPEGIPVYVDPIGLQDADKTMTSTFQMNLSGIPLATSLKLALAQLSLGYWVHPDGLLIITYQDSEDIPVDTGKVVLDEIAELRREIRALRDEVRASKGIEPPSHEISPPLKQTPAMNAAAGFR